MDAILEFFSALPRELYVFVISMLPIVELRGSIPVGAAIGVPFYINYPLSIVGNLLPVPFILLFITKFMDFLHRFKVTRPLVDWLRLKADKYSSKVLKDENLRCDNSDVKELYAEADSVAENATEAADATKEATSQNSFVSSDSVTNAIQVQEDIISQPSSAERTVGKKTEHNRKMTRGIFAALLIFVAIPLPGTGAWTGALVSSIFNLSKKHSMLAISIGVLISGVIMTLVSYGVLGFLSWLI